MDVWLEFGSQKQEQHPTSTLGGAFPLCSSPSAR